MRPGAVSADTKSAITSDSRTKNAVRVTVTAGIAPSSPAGAPTSTVTVSATGFGAGEGVDVFLRHH